MSTLEENLRVAQPEIEPLQKNKKNEREEATKIPIEDPNDNGAVYNKTTEEKPSLELRNILKQVSNLRETSKRT